MQRCFIVATLSIAAVASVAAQSKDKKSGPEQIGNRDVGTGLNFYSLEKEIALGKQMAQEVGGLRTRAKSKVGREQSVCCESGPIWTNRRSSANR
jgi:hypothetical protein